MLQFCPIARAGPAYVHQWPSPIHVTLSCGSCLTVMVHSCLLFQVPTSLPATQLILPSYFLGLVSVQAELADCFHQYPSFLGKTCYAWLHHKLAHRLCVCARACTCAHVCVFMWRPENSLWCLPQSTSIFFFESRSLTEPGCWQFGWNGLPASPRDPPICLSALGLCALASESGFNWVPMLEKQVLSDWAISLFPKCLSLLLIDNERQGQEAGRSHRAEYACFLHRDHGGTFFFSFLVP